VDGRHGVDSSNQKTNNSVNKARYSPKRASEEM
jgi:hypothetical protein